MAWYLTYRHIVLYIFLHIILASALMAQNTWTKTYGTERDDGGCSIQSVDMDSYLIAGFNLENSVDIWLLKIDNYGDTLWTKQYGGPEFDIAYSMIKSTDNNYTLVGKTNSFSVSSQSDVWILKINSDGSVLWAKNYGTSGQDAGYDICADSNGSVVIAGVSNSDLWIFKVDDAGNVLWSKKYDNGPNEAAYCISKTKDNGFIITGFSYSQNFSNSDLILIKTDSVGNKIWIKKFGDNLNDVGWHVCQTFDDGYIIAGENNGKDYSSEGLLLKVSENGNLEWSKTFNGNYSQNKIKKVLQLEDSSLVFYAVTSNYSNDSDVLLLKTTRSGQLEWKTEFGGAKVDEIEDIIATEDKGYLMCGWSRSYSQGKDSDIWLIKTNEYGNLLPYNLEEAQNICSRFLLKITCFPNPFNPETTIKYSLPAGQAAYNVKIKIYNAAGQLVKTLMDANQSPGEYTIKWNGQNMTGINVPSGIYFCEIEVGQFRAGQKMLLLR